MSPLVPVGVRVFAGLREPEEAGNVKALVLRVVALRVGALLYAELEVPSLLAKVLGFLVSPVIRRRVLGGAGIVVVRLNLGHLRDTRRRRCRHRLHPVGREITRELLTVFFIDVIIQVLTQQFVLRETQFRSLDERERERESNSKV